MILILLAACHPTVALTTLRPADLALPETIQSVAVVNRVGEGPAEEAVRQFADAAEASPRFEVVDLSVSQGAWEALKVEAPPAAGEAPKLQPETVAALCEGTHATGVVTLDSVDLASAWEYALGSHDIAHAAAAHGDGSDGGSAETARQESHYDATWLGSVASKFSFYTCDGTMVDQGGSIVLSDTATGSGPDKESAQENTGEESALEATLAATTGRLYAERVAPRSEAISRTYYKSGSEELLLGHEAVEKGDWTAAEALWEKASKADSRQVRGKALYNLAVAAEARGQYNLAVKRAQDAEELLWNDRLADGYLRRLEDRKEGDGKDGSDRVAGK